MLWTVGKGGEKNSRNKEYQFWRQGNHGIHWERVEFTLDKLNYMHNNRAKAGKVEKADKYLLNSAGDYYHWKVVWYRLNI